jgi:site-specific recombinase XerD
MAARKPHKLPVFLRAAEQEAFLATAQQMIDAAKTPKQRKRAKRDWVVVLLGLHTGLRVAEICALQVTDLDMDSKMLFVRAGKGMKDRAIPISDTLHTALVGWLQERRIGYVFESPLKGRRLSTRTLQARIPAIAEKAGITKRITPHKLRHSTASRLVERGVDIVAVRDILGHSSVAVSQVYLHCCPERLREAIGKL